MKPRALDVLSALRRGPMTSLQIWRELGIQASAQAVYELRGAGCVVDTELVSVKGRRGRSTVAKYRLRSAPARVLRQLEEYRRMARRAA